MRIFKKILIDRIKISIKLKVIFKPRTFNESLLRNKKCKSLIFMGLPRSGTSLVYDILNTHEKLYISYELTFQPHLYLSKKKQFSLYHELIRQSYMLNNNQFIQKNQFSKTAPFKSSYSYFGDKVIFRQSRKYSRKLTNALKKNFVDKLICIVRDPSDRYFSYQKWIDKRRLELPLTEKEDKENSFEIELAKWNNFINCMINLYNKFPDKVLPLSYELLLKKPEETLLNLNRFLNIEPFKLDFDRIFIKPKNIQPYYENIHDKKLINNTKRNFGILNSHFNAELYNLNSDNMI